MKVTILADVGGTIRDAASELRAQAAVRELSARGWTPTVLGRGGEAGALPPAPVPAPGITGDREGRQYLDDVRRFCDGDEQALGPGDPLRALRAHLATVDALYVAGGDLGSARPSLLYERAAAVLLARSVGRPVVLGGQTIGPQVDRPDAPALRVLLESAAFVTVTDEGSVDTWRALGLPGEPSLAHDDVAALLPASAPTRQPLPRPGPVVAVLSPDTRHVPTADAVRAYGRVLDALARRSGSPVVVVPPAVAEGRDVDLAFAQRVAGSLDEPAETLAWRRADEVLPVLAAASAVVTTHAHAALAAAASGVPLVTVALGHAEAVHLTGALAGWGLDPPVHLAALADAAASEAVLAALPTAGRPQPPGWRAEVDAGWDAVAAALAGRRPAQAVLRRAPGDARAPGPAASPDAAATPRVLIVTRTKDRPALLARALDDVLAQTCTRWHHVVVNDAGDPAPVDALVADRADAYAGRVSVLHRTRSTGMEAASNAGVGSRDSEFVVIHDDDDTWHPAFLERTLAHLDAHPGDAGVVVRTEEVYEWLNGDAVVEEERRILWPEIHEATLLDYLAVNRSVPIALLYRRSLHDAVGPYDESLPVVGDWDFHLRVLQRHRLGFLDGEPLAFWRKRREHAGTLGNSVEAHWGEHLHHDILVRDGHLRAWVAGNGLGLPLFVARTGEEHSARLHRRLDDLEAQLAALTDAVRAASDRADPLTRVARRARDVLRRARGR